MSLGRGEIRERYYNLLLKKDFAFYNGKIRSKYLYEEFTKYYPSELLETLGCPLNGSYKTWLPRMLDKTCSNVLYHPIQHFLLLKFLEIDVKKLFTEFVAFEPFLPSPYPCLNKVAPHYRELTISTCKISDYTVKGKKISRPVAIFECKCGFTYQRVGPDKSQDDLLRYNKVKNYGKYWETELSNHWANLDLPLTEIARQFGTTAFLIARHAIRLNLPMNTKGTRNLAGYARHRNPIIYLSERIQKNRSQWLKTLKKYPACSRQELTKKANTLYLWLQKNDSEWFNAHLPEQVKINRKTDRLNWRKIDVDLANKIQIICDEILNDSEKLTRVSTTEIIKRVGYKKWIDKRYQKLPKTTQLIDEKLETLEDFMIRKLISTETYYVKKKRIPTRDQLLRKASINNSTTHSSAKIQKEIGNSLTRIELSV